MQFFEEVINDFSWALSLQNGMIHTKGELYIIAHVPEHVLSVREHEESHGAHIIFKRSALPESHPAKDDSCGVSGKFMFFVCLHVTNVYFSLIDDVQLTKSYSFSFCFQR